MQRTELLNLEKSGLASSIDKECGEKQSLSELERVISGLTEKTAEPEKLIPVEIPFLGHIVPGAESCVILYSEPSKRKMIPLAFSNLSEDFIHALTRDYGESLFNVNEQANPNLLFRPAKDEEFRYLEECSNRDGLQTLWLFPWCNSNGSKTGTFLFASRQSFSPGREANVSVTFLSAWMSAILNPLRDCQHGSAKEESIGNEKPKSNFGEENRIIAVRDLINNMTASRHDNTGDTASQFVRTYKDKDGLPVTYDSVTEMQKKKSRSEDLSILWHELLSPLTVIKGYTSTLLQLNDAITEEQKQQYIRGIETASNRVIRLLENLRDTTRLEETGAMTTHPVYMYELLRITVSEMQSQTTKHIIKLRPSARLPRIKVDPEKIEQVISNLLVNATKYSPQGGDIEAEVQMVQNELEMVRLFGSNIPKVKQPCLIVSISDNGIGIPETELHSIFDKFYRVNTKISGSTPGVGLGLYICKIIIEAHGGQIWAKNRNQGGSVFSFSLPLDERLLNRGLSPTQQRYSGSPHTSS